MHADNSRDDFAHARVPDAARGSAWRVFFIVSGSMGGLPAFILAASLFSSLGIGRGLAATLGGALLLALLGGLSAFCGARARAGLAVLAGETFGLWGGRLVKLIIAVSLIGWFAVQIAVLGSAFADAARAILGLAIAPETVSVPFGLAVAAVTSFRIKGIERIGQMLVPLLAICLALTLWRGHAGLASAWRLPGTGTIGFGAAMSAVIGSYIVGVVVQPDYGRFVRRPASAGLAVAAALGVVYPVILLASALAAAALHQSTLIGAMIMLGLGIPALTILTLGAALDGSASLYSGSLSLASEMPRIRLGTVIAVAAVASVVLALLHVQAHFIDFLVALGIALPPMAVVLIANVMGRGGSQAVAVAVLPLHWRPVLAWAAGVVVGVLATQGRLIITELPTVDSMAVALVVLGVTWPLRRNRVVSTAA